jgi:hypothetical protein
MPTLKQLQAELSAAKAEIARLQQQNASLCEGLTQISSATELVVANPPLPRCRRHPSSWITMVMPTLSKTTFHSLQILSSLRQLRLQGQLLRSLLQVKLLLFVHLVLFLQIKFLFLLKQKSYQQQKSEVKGSFIRKKTLIASYAFVNLSIGWNKSA